MHKHKPFHIEVNGTPWCARELGLELNQSTREASRVEDIPLCCGHDTVESAQRMQALLGTVGVAVEAVTGACPLPDPTYNMEG